uniref:F-box domain-containing protein n=1 Tax=Steinernema glaseri TaxID=37863 RepID=A0A1I7ZCW4_9BILA
MDTLAVELVAEIVRLVNRDSKKHLCSTSFSWRPIAEEHFLGEFDLFIELQINSSIPSVDHAISIRPLISQSTQPWNDEFFKDVHLVRDVHLSIQNNFKWKHRFEESIAEEDFRFIQKIFAFGNHGRRMHLTLDVQTNGENPPNQCELLRRLLGAIPCLHVATVDHHNCVKRKGAAEDRRFLVEDLLRNPFERLGIPYVPGIIPQNLKHLLRDNFTAELSQADTHLEKYYVRSYPKQTDRYLCPGNTGIPFATQIDSDTLLIDFVGFRKYMETKDTVAYRFLHADPWDKDFNRHDLFNYCKFAYDVLSAPNDNPHKVIDKVVLVVVLVLVDHFFADGIMRDYLKRFVDILICQVLE